MRGARVRLQVRSQVDHSLIGRSAVAKLALIDQDVAENAVVKREFTQRDEFARDGFRLAEAMQAL